MIKGNFAQSVVPRHGKKFNSFGLLLLYWEIYHPFFEMRLF